MIRGRSKAITMARESRRERARNQPDLVKLTSAARAAASRKTRNGTATADRTKPNLRPYEETTPIKPKSR